MYYYLILTYKLVLKNNPHINLIQVFFGHGKNIKRYYTNGSR